MSLSSQLGSRFKSAFLGKAIEVASGALLLVLLARLLSPDGYGLLFLAISVMGVLKLFSNLGIAKSSARYIARYKETDPGQIAHILRFASLLLALTITVVSLFLLLFHEYLAVALGEPEIISFLLVGVLYIVFETLSDGTQRILQGFEAIKASSGLKGTYGGSRVVFAIGLVLLGYGAVGAFLGYVLGAAVTTIVGVGYIYRRYYRTAAHGERNRDLRRQIAEYSIPLTVTNTANSIDKQVDTILVGFFLGPVAVAYYTLSKQIITFLQAPIHAIGFTISPTLESEKGAGNVQNSARIYETSLVHALLLMMPGAAGLALIAESLIELVFGPEYLGAVPVLQVLSLYAVFLSVTVTTSNGLDFLGRARERAIVRGVTAVLNFGLNIVMIPWLGVMGAAIATVITFSMYTVANVYIISLELDLRVRWLLRYLAAVAAITGVMSGVVYLFVNYITGFVTLFAVVGLGVVVWAILATVTGLLDVRRILSVLT